MKQSLHHHHHENYNSLQGILNLSYAYQKSKVFLTACELDIFTILGNEWKSAREVAHEIDADNRAVEKLMNALASIDILQKKGEQFSNDRGARWFLVKESPDYIGNMQHLTDLWDSFGQLTGSIKSGKAVDDQYMKNMDEQEVRHCMSSMHWRAQKNAPQVIEEINLKNVTSMLDLGAGSGEYAMQFKKAKPGMEVFALELPNVLPITKEYVDKAGYSDKINFLEADCFKDDLGGGYDMVFVSSVIHRYSLFENIELCKAIYDSLNPNGKIVVYDYVLNDERTRPDFAAFHTLALLLTTKGGETYTRTDFWIILKEAWFRNVEVVEAGIDQSLIFGYK